MAVRRGGMAGCHAPLGRLGEESLASQKEFTLDTAISTADIGRRAVTVRPETPALACPLCMGDEDLAFVVEGLHEVTGFCREISALLSALLAEADAVDISPALRAIVERMREVTITYLVRQDGPVGSS